MVCAQQKNTPGKVEQLALMIDFSMSHPIAGIYPGPSLSVSQRTFQRFLSSYRDTKVLVLAL